MYQLQSVRDYGPIPESGFNKILTPIINSEISNSDFSVSEQADQTSPGVSRARVGKRKQQSAEFRYYDSP